MKSNVVQKPQKTRKKLSNSPSFFIFFIEFNIKTPSNIFIWSKGITNSNRKKKWSSGVIRILIVSETLRTL